LYWSPDTRPYADYLLRSPKLADVGLQITEHVDAIERATGKGPRREAKQALDDYMKELRKTRRGAARKGPPTHMMKALVNEGKVLFRLLWNDLAFDVGEKSATALRDSVESDLSDKTLRLWSLRLTLPFLSRPEILALRSESKAAASWTRADWRPAPRYFTVSVLSRRLGLNPYTLAEKTLDSRSAEYFSAKHTNPIDRHASS
jgi:hypothetical protein